MPSGWCAHMYCGHIVGSMKIWHSQTLGILFSARIPKYLSFFYHLRSRPEQPYERQAISAFDTEKKGGVGAPANDRSPGTFGYYVCEKSFSGTPTRARTTPPLYEGFTTGRMFQRESKSIYVLHLADLRLLYLGNSRLCRLRLTFGCSEGLEMFSFSLNYD